MTGTSLDGLDVSAVRAEGTGLEMRVKVVASLSRPLEGLSAPLRRLAGGEPMPAAQIAAAASELGELHARAVADLCEQVGVPVLVAAHGQTVFHRPPLSWQLLNPWPIARRNRCPVVHDLRGADLAAGGQGAPITPLADWVMFRSAHEGRAVVNLGGFCNLTILPRGAGPERVRGKDVCACNHLLDGAARIALGIDFDPGGENAAASLANQHAADELARLLGAQAGAGRSLGTGDESQAWLTRYRTELGPQELLATCVEGVARTIAASARGAEGPGVDRVILAGGGALNQTLARAIVRHCGGEGGTSESFGVPVAYREAAQMAVLGLLCLDRVPITLPGVTGVASPAPIAGSWIGRG